MLQYTMISALVFLGNPGRRYAMTRHNFGLLVCDAFTAGFDTVWSEKFKGMYTEIRCGGRKVVILKPLTWMNECGRSVQPFLNFFKLSPEELLVCHDDLEQPFGSIEVKKGGGTAGHKGLRSIQQQIGTADFNRLRLGIGRPERMPASSYVLSRFSDMEEAMLPDLTRRAGEMIGELLLLT